jgi:hypothetical protein
MRHIFVQFLSIFGQTILYLFHLKNITIQKHNKKECSNIYTDDYNVQKGVSGQISDIGPSDCRLFQTCPRHDYS